MNNTVEKHMVQMRELLLDDIFYDAYKPVIIKTQGENCKYLIFSQNESLPEISEPINIKVKSGGNETTLFSDNTFSNQVKSISVLVANLKYEDFLGVSVISDKEKISSILNENLESCMLVSSANKNLNGDFQYVEVSTLNFKNTIEGYVFNSIPKGLSLELVRKIVFDDYSEDSQNVSGVCFAFSKFFRLIKSSKNLTETVTNQSKENLISFLLDNMKNAYQYNLKKFEYINSNNINHEENRNYNDKEHGFHVNKECLEASEYQKETHFLQFIQRSELGLSQKEISSFAKELFIHSLNKDIFLFNETTTPYFQLLNEQDLTAVKECLNDYPKKKERFFKGLAEIYKENPENTEIQEIRFSTKKINPYSIHTKCKSLLSISYIEYHEPSFYSERVVFETNKEQRFLEGLQTYFNHAQEIISEATGISQDDIPSRVFNMRKSDGFATIRLFYSDKIEKTQIDKFFNFLVENINDTTLTNPYSTKEALRAILKSELIEDGIKQMSQINESSINNPENFSFKI